MPISHGTLKVDDKISKTELPILKHVTSNKQFHAQRKDSASALFSRGSFCS
jgi:hypothetical protein